MVHELSGRNEDIVFLARARRQAGAEWSPCQFWRTNIVSDSIMNASIWIRGVMVVGVDQTISAQTGFKQS